MSADQKKTTEEENFPFIQEQILSKKKIRLKRFFTSVIKTIVLAVIFGLVSSLVICLSWPFFVEFFGKNINNGRKPNIILISPTPVPTAAPIKTKAPEKTPEPAAEPSKEPEDKAAEQTMENYIRLCSLISEKAARVDRAIVTVSGVVSGIDLFNNPSERTDSTYGLILDDENEELLILTSLRKLEQASSVRVTFTDGITREAAVYGYDKELGIAVISVEARTIPEATRSTFESAVLGDSYYLTAGMPIMALGSPNGYVHSMEIGIISGKPYEKYITDSRLELFNTTVSNNENGEGIIANLSGEIVGIITHDFKAGLNKNVNTAMGISKLMPAVQKIINGEERPYFGIVASDLTEEHAKSIPVENGIFIMEVQPKSPAFNAGLQSGDIITKLGDKQILSVQSFSNVLSGFEEKDKAVVTVIRTSDADHPTHILEVEIGKRDSGQD